MNAYIIAGKSLLEWQRNTQLKYKLSKNAKGNIIVSDSEISEAELKQYNIIPIELDVKKSRKVKHGDKFKINFYPKLIPQQIKFTATKVGSEWEITVLEDCDFPLEEPEVRVKSVKKQS